jgi:Zn-dependent peptidase ImmA (M78 family)
MDAELASRISRDLGVSANTISEYSEYFTGVIKPQIKTKFLSHLVTSVEDMVNAARMNDFRTRVKERNVDFDNLLASKTLRLYSIILVPISLQRRATTRYHNSGAIIYYNSRYEENDARILIAHEIGHIVNKELLKSEDTEQKANLFAYVAMKDKSDFYEKECKQYVFKSDIAIYNEILNICSV